MCLAALTKISHEMFSHFGRKWVAETNLAFDFQVVVVWPFNGGFFFGGEAILQNCQLLKCNFLSENSTASSFLIRKRKIKYK